MVQIEGLPAKTSPESTDKIPLQQTDSTTKYTTIANLLSVIPSNELATTNKTADYTALTTDMFISADSTSAAVTITLPPAANVSGKFYIVKRINTGAFNVIVDADGSETIDGASSVTLATQWDVATVISNGTEWYTI